MNNHIIREQIIKLEQDVHDLCAQLLVLVKEFGVIKLGLNQKDTPPNYPFLRLSYFVHNEFNSVHLRLSEDISLKVMIHYTNKKLNSDITQDNFGWVNHSTKSTITHGTTSVVVRDNCEDLNNLLEACPFGNMQPMYDMLHRMCDELTTEFNRIRKRLAPLDTQLMTAKQRREQSIMGYVNEIQACLTNLGTPDGIIPNPLPTKENKNETTK